MTEKMVLWDYQARGRNEILEWADSIRLSKRDRGLLDQKMDALEAMSFDLATHTHLVAGPLNNSKDKHIYKLRVNGTAAIRLMMCRGPLAGETACTMLVGATERDRKLSPANAPEIASERRRNVCQDHRLYRRRHERFS
jgi:hypothetical protein